ncbi:hypothetical protein ATG98_3554 [Marinobacter sp. LV10R520-4]|uniref:hypothetical protein n=1 Tax=Marinobacter sp. LV10R520-4 TaxID=1761796 RepID=UPI000BF377C4|nr:hypothetical protein [Marinobacter sp. LV10R520-4]PFG54331.1 hypothetical protein ATG98_3554 [Marinobacter sp. LV10R520-4]
MSEWHRTEIKWTESEIEHTRHQVDKAIEELRFITEKISIYFKNSVYIDSMHVPTSPNVCASREDGITAMPPEVLIPKDDIHVFYKHDTLASWFESRFSEINKSIRESIIYEIIDEVKSLPIVDPILRGSSYSICRKLLAKFFIKNCKEGVINDASTLEEDSLRPFDEFLYVRLNRDDIIRDLISEYEKTHMRYRLWDDESINLLIQFLVKGDYDCTIFEDGAIIDFLGDRSVTENDFMEAVQDAILNLPISELTNTEVSFPEDSDRGIIFSEYVPVENMTNEQKENLLSIFFANLDG